MPAGRPKKNQSLVKSENSTILDKTNSIVDSIRDSKELSVAEKTFISDQFKISGALAAQEQSLKLKLAEVNAELAKSQLMMKKKGLQKILKQIKIEQTMTNNKVVGFIEMLQSKIEGGELSGSAMLSLEANQ